MSSRRNSHVRSVGPPTVRHRHTVRRSRAAAMSTNPPCPPPPTCDDPANNRGGRRFLPSKGVTTMPEAPTGAELTHEITDLERQTMARVARRLLPMLMACYFIAYLDR